MTYIFGFWFPDTLDILIPGTGLQSLSVELGFQSGIPWAVLWTPKPRIPDLFSASKFSRVPESRFLYMGQKENLFSRPRGTVSRKSWHHCWPDLAQDGNVSWRRESARKGLNTTSGAQFAALPLVKPVVWFARAPLSSDVPVLLLNQLN